MFHLIKGGRAHWLDISKINKCMHKNIQYNYRIGGIAGNFRKVLFSKILKMVKHF